MNDKPTLFEFCKLHHGGGEVLHRFVESKYFVQVKADLDKAIQYLREGKAKYAPGTTNSFVDDLLAKYPQDSDQKSGDEK